jgi:cytochrome c-type biogenesis protein
MSDFFVNQIFDGNLLFAALIAIIAGLVSFLSPCVIPLVPGYLAYVSGMAGTRGRMLLGSILFVGGFTLLFTSYGLFFGGLGSVILTNSGWLIRFLGLLTLLFGVIFIFSEKFYRSYKFPVKTTTGLVGAPVLGFMFGLGWTPCIGPTLGAVQTISFIEASAARGAILSIAYCFGLGAPFIFFALFLDKFQGLRNFIMKHRRVITFIGGGFLILIGILQITGTWEDLMAGLRSTISSFVPVI